MMAIVYGTVKLLPPGHPYLLPKNMGKFGIRHVVGEAANNLVFKRQNADQIMVFFVLLTGIVILALQFILMIYALLIQPALAQAVPIPYLFDTPRPFNDMAFLLLDNVFGVPKLFCNNAGQCTSLDPQLRFPFHIALHSLFQFYSLAIMLLGVIIFLYFALVVVAETAATGHPFGQRFENIWVPIRLVVALGLLVPINYGLNSAQYITLYAAKFGSGFATNAWIRFNNTVRTGSSGTVVFTGGTAVNPSGERNSLIAKPIDPDISSTVQFMSIVHACVYAQWKLSMGQQATQPAIPANFAIKAYFVKNPYPNMGDSRTYMEVQPATTYQEALTFYGNSDILIRFGERDTDAWPQDTGNVHPYCGDIRIRLSDLMNLGKGQGNNGVGGSDMIQNFYFDMVKLMWFGNLNSGPTALMKKMAYRFVEVAIDNEGGNYWQCHPLLAHPDLPQNPLCLHEDPDAGAKQKLINAFQAQVNGAVTISWDTYNKNGTDIAIKQSVIDRGWAGAGIWYNVIAQLNGAFTNAVVNIPSVEKYPFVMELVRAERSKSDSDPSGLAIFDPNLSNGEPVKIDGPTNSTEIAVVLSNFYKLWNKDGVNQAQQDKTVTGSAVRDLINTIFGTKGLFAMRGANAHIHPLAQLSSLGKNLVDQALFLIGGSAATSFVSGALQALKQPNAGALFEMFTSFASSIAFILLITGMILYYILPFLPFLYFYFAVGTWVMSIYEAMVGVPLWALAHLRIEGEGLPGESASSGYFLIFEIFLRPILTVFGLIAAMLIFPAQARILNFVWNLVVDNLTGWEGSLTMQAPGFGVDPVVGEQSTPRDVIDDFFFTILYATIIYMMAIASFKLIDRIPDGVLRYMGSSASSFSAIHSDPTEGLTRYAAYGGLSFTQKVTEAVSSSARSGGAAIGGELFKLGGGKTGP
ncbi:MAG: DotA/TraY family protein [Alphaproteobacteria bacterium]|nr:DotA/TraY family protein [Alphaproteobacteria bacterium]